MTTQPRENETNLLAQRDRRVLDHLQLVRAIALRVRESLPVHIDLDDMVHAGILGLFDAAGKYDGAKSIPFSVYAKHRIKGAMLDSLRQSDWASRDLRRRQKQAEVVSRELSATLQRMPTEEEMAERLSLTVERWRRVAMDLRNGGLVSVSEPNPKDDDLPAIELRSKPETQPDSMCVEEEMRSLLGSALKTLPERHQKVVSLYYKREMSMKEIGGMLGIKESRVSQIHKCALAKMANVLHSTGIHSAAALLAY